MSLAKFEGQLAGYKLLQRIGAGGYGEVWKAEAPGGLAKAIKLIYGYLGEERASRELKALQRIKEVRHPFLLSLERIEIFDGQLAIFTELADSSLKERFQQCQDAGLPGIARSELLNYLRDAADALDYMSEHFSLQHLDIKPENMLLLGGRIKVADFGLVKEIENVTVSMMGGMTPVYAAPELFDGRPSRHSDQYSLAIVYQEMLTGNLPFPGKTTTQLANQHLHNEPLLLSLPPGDRPIIARSLAKDPLERFPSCKDLIDSLFAAASSHANNNVAPPLKPQAQRCSTVNFTQVCDTKSRPGHAAYDECHHAIPADSARQEGISSPAESLAGIASDDILPSLDKILTAADRPSSSSPESVPAASDDSWLKIEGKAAFTPLPPLNIKAAGSLRPVLVIGAGGAAGRVLGKLQERIRDHWEDDLPAFQMLLLDADSRALAGKPAPGAIDLPSGSKLPVSLRRLEKYHEISAELLRWLDRRWLYNLPRSGRPEGLRPLGRLAFVDNSEEILLRLRAILGQLLAPESLEITSQLTGLPVGSPEPEIYLISSLGGGTGSGMIFDLAYAVRQALAEMEQRSVAVRGILTFSTPRHPDEKKLALANAHAALRELQHYSSSSASANKPFDEIYCVEWGENLDDSQFEGAAERTADYLFAATLAPQRIFFDACRAASAVSPATNSSPEDATRTPNVKSFGLRQLICSRKAVPQIWVDYLCRKIVDRWRGEEKCNARFPSMLSPEDSADASPLLKSSNRNADAENGPPDVSDAKGTLSDLRHRICGRLSTANNVLNKADFSKMLEDSCSESALAHGEPINLLPRHVLQAINLLLGPVRPLGEWVNSPESSMQKNVCEMLGPLTSVEIRNLGEKILQSGGSLPGGFASASANIENILAEVRREDEQNRRSQKHLLEIIGINGKILSAQPVSLSSSRKSWWPFGSSAKVRLALAPGWLEYADCRRELTLLQIDSFILQALKARLSALNEKLRELQHDLQRLAFQYPVEKLPTVDAEEASLRIVYDELRARAAELVRICDERCRGLALMESSAAYLSDDGDFQLVQSADKMLRHSAEEVLLECLRPMMAEVWTREAAAGSVKVWEDIFESAKPLFDDCKGTARILLSAPEPLIAPLRQICLASTGCEPTALISAEEQILVCYELEHLSLPLVAVHCLKDQPELSSLARRLHTRNDVPWSLLQPLPG
jgi:eukaryotic-like serine/threonine-protein kinase